MAVDDAAVRASYESGLSLRETCRKHKLSGPGYTRTIILRAGGTLRPPSTDPYRGLRRRFSDAYRGADRD